MWTIVLAVIVLLAGIFMFKLGAEIFEESHFFWAGVSIFFVLFIVAACAISLYGPKPENTSDVSALFASLWPTSD